MRRNINMIIVFLSSIIAAVLWFLGIVGVIPVILCMVLFNLISLIYYGETRLVIAYHIVTILMITGFFVTSYGLIPQEDLALLFMSFMDIGSFALFFISFGIILQNRMKLSLERIMMLITVYNIIFYTSTRFTILGYVVGFFRTPELNSVENIVLVFTIVNYVFMFIIAFVQAFLIYKFDERLSRREYLEEKRIKKIEKLFY
ncbi:hypothetical protein KHQ88_01885 [Mycoplasmatota bacterium]|nr:hypothetical protein KHQ88_01885 [Mycoplasmatota bacterium]